MEIKYLKIRNYKFIKDITISSMENAAILVGRNSTGKTAILDAIVVACGQKEIKPQNFAEDGSNIEITITLHITSEDLQLLHRSGRINRFKKYELFLEDFYSKFPTFENEQITFTYSANRNGQIRYSDSVSKDNPNIELILPKIYYIDHTRNVKVIEKDILEAGLREDTYRNLKYNKCMFDESKFCNACFQCIGKISKKKAFDLSLYETEKLLEYKMLHADCDEFLERLNRYYQRNSNSKDVLINHINVDPDAIMSTNIVRYREGSERYESVEDMSEGMKSIYILSLLEAYMKEEEKLPCIIMMEDPELFLHPQLQKNTGELLYKLSEKNQIIFSTHSPNMIFSFNKRQIKQVYLDKYDNPCVSENNEIGTILNDLGYSANDLLGVSFVFIVEGKQDKSRLPLLLNKFYSEIYDKDGNLQRIAIISTNSCTNISTYANLKYINQVYLKDNFLMIRDGDGKDKDELINSLCEYYDNRGREDKGGPARVKRENVLVLKYYSFENYFLNPEIMAKIGVIDKPDDLYDILWKKYKEYLYKNKSFINLCAKTGVKFQSAEDIKNNMELIRIYGRGHNLYDIFYGRYKGDKENEILTRYIDNAERKDFADICDSIDAFVYFDSRKQ